MNRFMLQRQSLAVVVWITHLADALLVDLQLFIYEKVIYRKRVQSKSELKITVKMGKRFDALQLTTAKRRSARE
jgi:hypothetical protein